MGTPAAANGFVVLGDSGARSKGNRNIIWRVQCHCGNIKLWTVNHIKANKSCGCQRIDSQRKAIGTGHEEIGGSYWSKLKKNAATRRVAFEVSIEYAWLLFVKQNRRCALTGVELCFATRCDTFDGTASLDRRDATIGYTESNVQWVHKEINFMKQQFSVEKFLGWCQKVCEYNKTV